MKIIVGFFAFLILFGVFLFSFYGQGDVYDDVCFSESCVSVEVAETADERAFGLMNRTSLCADCGMIFVYTQEGAHYFWMKDTLIPLDMLWIDKDGMIVYVERNAEPCVSDPCTIYGTDLDSMYVLEVNSGYADSHGIDVGDMVSIRLG